MTGSLLIASFVALAAFPMMIWLFFSRSDLVCKLLLIGIVTTPVIYGGLTFTQQMPG